MSTDEILALSRARLLARTGAARRVREACELSLAEVAEAVGVDTTTVQRWETGQRRPRGDAAVRYVALIDELVAELATEGTEAADAAS